MISGTCADAVPNNPWLLCRLTGCSCNQFRVFWGRTEDSPSRMALRRANVEEARRAPPKLMD